MMKIKRHINRFRAWQRKPIQFSDQGLKEHCCANCGHTYTGNYCPICGQEAGDKRTTWRLIGQNLLKAWGIDSRSLPSTLLQLILRPGYLIGDYLDGHRRVSYPPVNTLFVVTVFYLIITQMFGITRLEYFSYSDVRANYAFFVDAINWMIDNPAWGMMCVTLMFVIPTRFLFRFAPQHPYHTFAEGFLIQIYMATIVLIATFISNITDPYIILPALIIVYYYFTYRQLFGYRFWGTLWRLLISIVVAFWEIVLSIIIVGFTSSTGKITGLFRTLIIIVALLAVGYYISRRTAKNRCATDDN